jgi:hypothetical protein
MVENPSFGSKIGKFQAFRSKNNIAGLPSKTNLLGRKSMLNRLEVENQAGQSLIASTVLQMKEL